VEDVVTRPAAPFWQGRRVLVTGHTGFKGAWLALWLERLGAAVTGVALAPATEPSLFELAGVGERVESHLHDIRDAAGLAEIVRAAEPEIVLHLAAQPLVRPGYARPLETFETNVLGTANLLDALRHSESARVVVAVTTDKVYHNLETDRPYREADRLGGHDPYSASKACAELVAACYRDAFLRARDVRLATARAGNVIGGGDWSEDRLIPDAVRAWQADTPLLVRNPAATRPWQHALDPLAAYLRLAELLWDHAELADAYNFGPDAEGAAPVRAVIERAREAYGRGETVFAEAPSGPHEAGLLALDNRHARDALGIAPRWPLAEAIERTMAWYRGLAAGANAAALCLADIDAYERAT
jgi:CDP-glucose 4,6-dehydratase